ncbi:MAG: energy transducer TonB [Halothiobacillaceae bacterium]|nr:energy transducer TonB [Halothiobacillaceae bacterium]
MNQWALDQNAIASDKRFIAALIIALLVHAALLMVVFNRPAPIPPPPRPIELTLDAPLAGQTDDASPVASQTLSKQITPPTLASAQGDPDPTSALPKAGAGITTTGNAGATDTPNTQSAPDTFTRLNDAVSQSLKTGYMTSKSQDGPIGAYLSSWKRQVEQYGNLHYPPDLAQQALSGQLILDVTIDKQGHILNIAIRHTSGNPAIDAAARRLVQLASPYAPFPKAMAAQFDQIVITRTWAFSSGNELSTH